MRSVRLTAVVLSTGLMLSSGKSEQLLVDQAQAQEAASPASPSLASESAPTPAARENLPPTGPLQVIGALGASHVYTTFGYIGVTADALTKEVYPPKQVAELMTEVSSMCDNLMDQMSRVPDADLTMDDRAALAEMIAIYELLKAQSEALKHYAANRNEASAAEFDQARKTVWPRISRLLGMEPPSQ